MSKIVPLDQIQGTMPRIGKLSAGYMEKKTQNGRTITFPAKSRTLVFRCANPDILHAAAKIVGGTVSKSPNPKVEGVLWRLVSEATDLDVLIAADDRLDAPARYEAWGASGKIRECDGHTCRFLIDPKTGERRDTVPCWCAAQGLAAEDADACRITTRLNLFIPAFATIPGIGVWQLESRGRTTYQDLKGLRDLFQRMGLPGAMGAPVTLRVEIVRRRSPGTGDPQEFPVFRFQSRLSLTDTLARTKEFAATVQPAQLPPPDDSVPPLGAVLSAEEEALASATPIIDARMQLEEPAPADAAVNAVSPDEAARELETEPAPTAETTRPDDLATLICQAAAAAGCPSGRAWLKQYCAIEVASIQDIPVGQLAAVRARAIGTINDHDNARATGAEASAHPSVPRHTAVPPAGPGPSPQPVSLETDLLGPEDDELAVMTPEEARELTDLIVEAARAEHSQTGRAWLETRYHIEVSSVEAIAPHLRGQIRADALAIVTSQRAPGTPFPPILPPPVPHAATTSASPSADQQPGPATDTEPTASDCDKPPVLTPDAATELRTLIAEAADVEGFKGKTASRAWVTAHYGITNGTLKDVAPEMRERMRKDALASIAARKQPTNGEAAAGTARAAAGPAAGHGQNAPAAQSNAPAETTVPAGALPASADQLEAIQRECTIRGIVKPQDNPGIAQSARRTVTRFEELTQAEADRVLRYLKYVPLRTTHTASPA